MANHAFHGMRIISSSSVSPASTPCTLNTLLRRPVHFNFNATICAFSVGNFWSIFTQITSNFDFSSCFRYSGFFHFLTPSTNSNGDLQLDTKFWIPTGYENASFKNGLRKLAWKLHTFWIVLRHRCQRRKINKEIEDCQMFLGTRFKNLPVNLLIC